MRTMRKVPIFHGMQEEIITRVCLNLKPQTL